MRSQLPGKRRKKRSRGLLNPQHRMVLGLVSMSAATLMLSLMYQKDDGAAAAVPKDASTRALVRSDIPLPVGRPPATSEANSETVGRAVKAVGPGILSCVDAFADSLEPWEGASTRIEVQLDRSGIVRADVLELRGLPEPFVGCLGAAVGTQDWPSGGEDIVLIRVPITIPERARAVDLRAPATAD